MLFQCIQVFNIIITTLSLFFLNPAHLSFLFAVVNRVKQTNLMTGISRQSIRERSLGSDSNVNPISWYSLLEGFFPYWDIHSGHQRHISHQFPAHHTAISDTHTETPWHKSHRRLRNHTSEITHLLQLEEASCPIRPQHYSPHQGSESFD